MAPSAPASPALGEPCAAMAPPPAMAPVIAPAANDAPELKNCMIRGGTSITSMLDSMPMTLMRKALFAMSTVPASPRAPLM